jgi:outer membrane lipoprotein SlyB
MFKTYTCLALLAATSLTACAVIPVESSPYAQNQAPVYAQPMNASYNTTQTRAADPNCQRRETNRELIGGAVGGTVGAFAGKELIGGTKGTVAGAALGGVVGYGLGDISTNCAPAARSNAVYQSAAAYSATAVRYEAATCPAGTTPYSNGTCLLDNPNANLQSLAVTAAPTPSYQQAQTAPRTQTVINASTAPMAPSAYMATEVTRSYGGANYRVAAGDTVYSLSRKLCVPVTAIQGSNGLDANFGIQVGQNLNLPASQC